MNPWRNGVVGIGSVMNLYWIALSRDRCGRSHRSFRAYLRQEKDFRYSVELDLPHLGAGFC